MEAKQVIVIRRDVKMRRGKEIAQGAHASMMWLSRRLSHSPLNTGAFSGFLTEAERSWLTGMFTKVVCQVDSDIELLQIVARAARVGVMAHTVTDAGLTEFGGVPTLTAVAIGPDWCHRVDEVTGDLKLY